MEVKEEKRNLSTEDLKKVGEWLKAIDLSQERINAINPQTENIINSMSFINPSALKEPYTL